MFEYIPIVNNRKISQIIDLETNSQLKANQAEVSESSLGDSVVSERHSSLN